MLSHKYCTVLTFLKSPKSANIGESVAVGSTPSTGSGPSGSGPDSGTSSGPGSSKSSACSTLPDWAKKYFGC